MLMGHLVKVILLSCMSCLFIPGGMAQDNQQIFSILDHYPGVYGKPDGYLNGRRNSFVYPAASGTPYFMLQGEHRARLQTVYGDYDSLLMKYDLLNDEVILGIGEKRGMEEIRVNKDIVQGFNLFGRKFVHLRAGVMNTPGYYEQVYDGSVKCYIKHTKTLSQTSGPIRYEYRYNTRKILMKDGKYHTVRNTSALLSVLGQHQKELKSFIRKNHILFRSASGDEMARILSYYESL